MPRHRLTSLATVTLLNDAAKLIHRNLVHAHLDQCAHNGTYHVAQKTVGGDGKHPLLALPVPSRARDMTNVGLHIGVQLAERSEIAVLQ